LLFHQPTACLVFGALNPCKAARSSFSKFAVPAVRFASETALSAARCS
jgi:hypothetical protein